MSAHYGLKPQSGLWLYKAVVRAKISHGVIVWAKALEKGCILNALNSLQNYCFQLVGSIRKNTPTAALEVITGTYPIDLFLKSFAVQALIRTKGYETFSDFEMNYDNPKQPTLIGHRQYIKKFMKEYGAPNSLLNEEIDKMTSNQNFNKKYLIDSYSWCKENPKRGFPRYVADANIYTDGSKLKRGQSGGAFVVYKIKRSTDGSYVYDSRLSDGISSDKYYLEDQDIWICELFSIKQACSWIMEHAESNSFKSIDINVDSLSAIQALKAYKVRSKLV